MQLQTAKPVLVAGTVGRQLVVNSSVQEDDGVVPPNESLLRGHLKNSETMASLESLLGHLGKEQHAELPALINDCLCLFNDVQTCTHLIEHDFDVGDTQLIRQRFYQVSVEKRKITAVYA